MTREPEPELFERPTTRGAERPLQPAIVRSRRRDRALGAALMVAAAAGGAGGAMFALGAGAASAGPEDARAAAAAATPVALPVPVPVPILIRAATEAGAPEDPHPAIDIAHVIHEGGLRVVLEAHVDPAWLGGAGEVEDDDGITVVTRPLSEMGRAAFAPALGTVVRLEGRGSRCLAKVTGLAAVGRYAGDHVGEPPPEPAVAWRMAREAGVIAGDLQILEGSCDGATWARSASLPAPAAAAITPAPVELRDRAAAALAAHDEVRQLVADLPEVERDVVVRQIEGAGDTLLVATQRMTGCSDLEPAFTAIYQVTPEGELRLLSDSEIVAEVLAAIDADGDGHLELLVSPDDLARSLLRRKGGTYALDSAVRAPIYGCRC